MYFTHEISLTFEDKKKIYKELNTDIKKIEKPEQLKLHSSRN